jgi:hypothetical protein
MPKFRHESFVRTFDKLLSDKLDAYEGGGVDCAVQRFDSCGSTDVILVPCQAKAVAERLGLPQRSCYRPEASRRLFDINRCKPRRPGLVVRVCSTQSKDDALNKLPFYFASTNAEVRCLIIVDLIHPHLKTTVSVYVAKYDGISGDVEPIVDTIVMKDDEVRHVSLFAHCLLLANGVFDPAQST